MGLPDEEAEEVVKMIIECCSQERSYQRFYGLLGQRFCEVNAVFQVSTRILGRRTHLFHLSLFLSASRVVLPKILVLSALRLRVR